MDQSELREIFIERMQLPRLIRFPLETVDGVNDIFLKVRGIGKHACIIAFVAPCQQVSVIHIFECCETLEYMRVLFHIHNPAAMPRRCRIQIGTPVYMATLGLILWFAIFRCMYSEESDPLSSSVPEASP